MENVTGEPREGSILAVDPGTGDRRWRFALVSPPTSGMLSTGGGLLFAGTAEGYFVALDAAEGKPLWRLQTGGPVRAPAITYRFEGRQYVATAAGSAIIAFALPR
jgi:alcohol dehydrogenase (cytochrome c)